MKGEVSKVPTAGQLGDFRLIRLMGSGGMGQVFEALQVSLNRKVAVKILPSGFRDRDKMRFEREAHVIAALDHPGIVSQYGYYESPGLCYYAMEYVEGVSLDRVILLLKRATIGEQVTVTAGVSGDPGGETRGDHPNAPTQIIPVKRPNIDPGQSNSGSLADVPDPASAILAIHKNSAKEYFHWVADVCRQLAEALQYAHERGIVHRDIKPGNIMITPEGKVKVCDFGLATDIGSARLTFTGEMMGTPAYMSPEQIAARRVPIDHRTDIYSLGIVLYEFLALQVPFKHESAPILFNRIMFAKPPCPRKANSSVPSDLEAIATKAISKSPDDRYQTAKELTDDLNRYVGGQPVMARELKIGDRLRRWCRSRISQYGMLRVVGILCALILVVTVGTLVGTLVLLASVSPAPVQRFDRLLDVYSVVPFCIAVFIIMMLCFVIDGLSVFVQRQRGRHAQHPFEFKVIFWAGVGAFAPIIAIGCFLVLVAFLSGLKWLGPEAVGLPEALQVAFAVGTGALAIGWVVYVVFLAERDKRAK